MVSRAGANQVRAENWAGCAHNANHWYSMGNATDDTRVGVFPKHRKGPAMRPLLTVYGVSILEYMSSIAGVFNLVILWN